MDRARRALEGLAAPLPGVARGPGSRIALASALSLLCLLTCASLPASPQQIPPGLGPQGQVILEADHQHRVGSVYYADGNVEIRRGTMRLQAQHAEYNDMTNHVVAGPYPSWQASKMYSTGDAVQPSPPNGHYYLALQQGASGARQPSFPVGGGATVSDGQVVWRESGAVKPGPAVVFDDGVHHLEAARVDYDVRAGSGHFQTVHGTVRVPRPPNPLVLATTNPITFDARAVDRIDADTYRIYHSKFTICDPNHPTWSFHASKATLHVNDRIALVSANFRIFRVPLVYLPYASVPSGKKQQQSGFLLPEVGNNSIKGYIIGDSYYWAPAHWADATIGAEYYSSRGWAQNFQTRILPSENLDISATYFGVVDRLNEGGHLASGSVNWLLPDGWHAVANVNQLSSMLFQEVFAPTYTVAINSEVHNTAFLTNNFHGFSANFAVDDFKDFLTVLPQTTLDVRTAPEGRFSSVDQAPWKNWPLYFGFDIFSGAVHRDDPLIDTPNFVDRSQLAPRVTLPLHFGSWLGVTSSYSVDVMRYGAQDLGGIIVNSPLWETAREVSVDLVPPTLERSWKGKSSTWTHTIEPRIDYTDVAGVNSFPAIIRTDQYDTMTDTNQFEYSITQRLFRRKASGTSDEIASWTLLQDYYFDPTFGGALIPGVRNVFAALDSVTPFAFADGFRRFSPLVSDIRFAPGGPTEFEFRNDYDPIRQRITATEALFRTHVSSKVALSFAQFDLSSSAALEPPSNQFRATVSYGALNNRGWNAAATFSYDILNSVLQYQTFQGGYNSSCCGISFQYQRISIGTFVDENEFRIAFTLANIGSFGTLRRQDAVGAVF